jgi:hypothetical protein
MLTDEGYEQLGTALSEKLNEKLSDIEPTPEFRARLEREFAAVRAKRATSRKRRWALSAPLPITAAGAAAILLFAASEPAPAFAVSRGTDGTVMITLNEITGVSGANSKLRSLDVNNVVVVPITAGCTTQIAMSYLGTGSAADSAVTVTPGAIPTGTTVVLAAEQTAQGQIEEAIGRVSGPAPTCVAPAPAGANGTPTGPVAPHATAPTNTAGGDS